MNLQHLRCFLAVVEHMNLSQAAETLGISQPALSKTMAKLQADLCVQLYVRNGRGIALTDAGTALRRRAEAILAEVAETQELMSEMRSGLTGHVRIGAGPSFLTRTLPDALVALEPVQPEVRYTIREGTTQELCDWIKTREIDCALLGWVRSDRHATALDPDLAFHRLLVDDLVIVTREDHPLHQRPPRRLADLSPYGWILPRMSTRLQGELNRLYAEAGETPPSARVQTSSLFATCAMLRRSDLITLLARNALSAEDTAGLLPLRQDWLPLQREAYLVTLKGLQLPPAASRVVDQVRRLLVAGQAPVSTAKAASVSRNRPIISSSSASVRVSGGVIISHSP